MQDGDDGRSGDKCIGRRKGEASEVGREIELRCGKEGKTVEIEPLSLRVWNGRIRAFGVFQVFGRCAIYFKGKEGIERCASVRSGAGGDGACWWTELFGRRLVEFMAE